MKKYVILILFCAISILLVPLSIKNTQITPANTTANTPLSNTYTTETNTENQQTISVFRTVTNTTENITMFEYVCGSVAAEMPLAYNEEALKAQAVACFTNALRLKAVDENKNDGSISDDTSVHQGYIDVNQRKEKWGKDFEKYEKKLQKIVQETENEALYYNGSVCVAAFSAISNGNTENAQNLWGTKVDYLVSVDSSADKLSPNYASTVSYSKDNFFKKAEEAKIPVNKSADIKNIIKVTKTSETGTVLEVNVNGKSYTGEEIRKAFSLRSPTFTIKATDSTITFSVHGYGHGIGLSQYGANALAEKGYNYKQILAHYYTGTEIREISN